VKLYLLCDMEGASGLFRREQAWFWEPRATEADQLEGQRLLTADVGAAVVAALEAGADSLVVCDTHHGGGNLLREVLPTDPRVTYELPTAPRLMPSLDETFDGVLLLGHHAKAGTGSAFLEHSWGGNWFDVTINGTSVGEIGLETCYAGHWDVPLILVQGDEACCAEAAAQFPGTVTAAVKRGLSFDRAEGLPPEAAHRLTAAKIAEAIQRLHDRGKDAFHPYRATLPMTVRIVMNRVDGADAAASRPGVRRVGGRTVEATLDRQCDVLAWVVGKRA
jgi:D-amino peptidase